MSSSCLNISKARSSTLISSKSAPVSQAFQIISGPSSGPHQSILYIFHQLELRHVATKLCCGQVASVPSIILALSLHIKALKACIIELTSVLVRNLILYSLWRPRSQCVTTDRDEERERQSVKALKPCNNCGFTLWPWQASIVPWASTKLMKKQQWGNGVELGP